MIIGGLLTTALVCLNYTRGLVELFTFLILLATLNTLIPYAFSSLAVFVLPDRGSARHSRPQRRRRGARVRRIRSGPWAAPAPRPSTGASCC